MNQKFSVKNDVAASQIPSEPTVTMRARQEFWGVGLRGGINTEWHFNRNWSIYGGIAVSELYCQFNDKRRDENETDDTILLAQSLSFHTIKPVLEMSAGFRYETFYSQDRYQLFLQAGWEEQIWFDQNHFIDLNQSHDGDLVFQGFDIKLGFSF